MNPEMPLGELLAQVRAGDPAATDELLRRYEPSVRLAVRTRLTDPALRRQFDSTDVCQSVFLSFYIRAAAGQFDLDRPEALVGLLVRMALNKVAGRARYHRRARRDVRRVEADGGAALGAAPGGTDPARAAAARELLDRVRAELTPDERRVADLRAEGRSWAEVAAELGGTPEARRKQFERAVERVARRLGLDEEDPDERS